MDDQMNQVEAGPGEAARAQFFFFFFFLPLRGEDLETVPRSLGVTAATLSGWREAFLAAGEAALSAKPASGEELASERLKAKLGAALIERDLLHEKIAILEANRPLARKRRAP